MQPWLSPPPSGNVYVLTYHGTMPKLLSNDAIATFKRDGFYSPVRVMSAADAQKCRKALEAHEAPAGKPLQGNWRHKTHLLFTWADEQVRLVPPVALQRLAQDAPALHLGRRAGA